MPAQDTATVSSAANTPRSAAATETASSRPAPRRISIAAASPATASSTTTGAKPATVTVGNPVRWMRLTRCAAGPNSRSAARSSAGEPPRPSCSRSAASSPARPIAKPLPASPSSEPHPSTLAQHRPSWPSATVPVPAETTTPGPPASAPNSEVTPSLAITIRRVCSARPRASLSRSSWSGPAASMPDSPTPTAAGEAGSGPSVATARRSVVTTRVRAAGAGIDAPDAGRATEPRAALGVERGPGLGLAGVDGQHGLGLSRRRPPCTRSRTTRRRCR